MQVRARRWQRAGHNRANQPHVSGGDDQRGGDDRGADDGYLTVLHLKVSVGQPGGQRPAARGAAGAPRIYVNRDRGEEEDPGEHACKLRRERRQAQPVAEHREREEAKERAPERAAPAEHRRSAEYDGRNGVELVAVAGIRSGLSQVGHVDHRSQARDQARQQVDQAHAPRDWDSGVARPRRRKADRIERAPDDGTVQQDDVGGEDKNEERKLRRNNAPQVSLPNEEKPGWKAAVVHRRLRDAFGDASKEREGAERDDEGRDLQPRDEHGVERTAGTANGERDDRGDGGVKPPVAAGGAEDDRRESHHRPDRQIDAAGDDHRRERDGQQSELHAEPRDLEEIPRRGEVRRDDGKERDLGSQRDEQDRVAGTQSMKGRGHGDGGRGTRTRPDGPHDGTMITM